MPFFTAFLLKTNAYLSQFYCKKTCPSDKFLVVFRQVQVWDRRSAGQTRVGMVCGRGTSRGSVWLSWQTLLHCRYSALKPIKYQTLSLQVSNAGVLEQATAYISLLTLHSTITKRPNARSISLMQNISD